MVENESIGTERIHRRRFPTTRLAAEKIQLKREQLKKQREVWDLQRELEDEMLEFREIQEAWLEDLVTLDDVLEELMESGLCEKLSVWRNRK